MTKVLVLFSTFLSALLLFVVQPLFAKYLLPYFGGTPSVWTISVFFYSAVLLAGYVYAAIITSVRGKAGYLIHSALLLIALGLLLERTFTNGSALLGSIQTLSSPALSVFGTLVFTLGLPVLLLASTSIVTQYLYARLTDKEPYALFALSNTGSLIGLAIYPFVLEPFTDLENQVYVWLSGFIVFALILILAWTVSIFFKTKDYVFKELRTERLSHRGQIILMAAIPTLLLASITEFFSRGIASFPFLWVVPLMVYLISFILAFRSKLPFNLPVKPEMVGAILVFPVFSILLMANANLYIFWFSFALMMVTFIFITTYFHRKIYELRPRLSDLGNFYVWVTIGGAIGSGLVGFIFPQIFNQQVELEWTFLGLLLYFLYRTKKDWQKLSVKQMKYVPYIMISVTILFFVLGSIDDKAIAKDRNFFDNLQVVEETMIINGEPETVRTIVSGVTYHGSEWVGGEATTSVSYYGPGSGINTAVKYFNDVGIEPALSVIGLGAGVMSVYCDSVSKISFKEINPAVLEFAEDYFTYLDICPEKTEVIIADGRLALEKMVEEGGQTYDIIMMDAFTDDAIPVHLLTQEAFSQAYIPLLSEGGIIAFHVSNRYLNLYPPIVGNARSLGLDALAIKASEVSGPLANASLWVLVADAETIDNLLEYPDTYEYQKEEIIWTDEKNSIFEALEFNMSVSNIKFSAE